MKQNEEKHLQKMEPQAVDIRPPALTSLDILNAAVSGGITSESVGVVERIIAMRREEVSAENKAKFNRAFFELRQEIASMDFYADKAAKTDSGAVAYAYCSEKELSSKLDPVLFKHGFAMLFGQRDEGAKTVAIITLIHKDGHEENREYAVHAGGTNRMKDATAADTGATTSAWRHLVIKMFGIKSRIQESADPRNEGSKIDPKYADELEHRAEMLNAKKVILEMAGAKTFREIMSGRAPVIENALAIKERAGR